jgi:hypothetical protein
MQMLQHLAPADNPIRNMWNLGYRSLVSILPVDANVSEHTLLHKRMLAGEDPRGKAPGRRRRDGLWSGYDFTDTDPTEADLDAWAEWGAGCGIRCGDGLVAVDIDTKDRAAAKAIYELAQSILGPANVRFGERPKALLLYATPADAAIPYRKLRFATETESVAHIELITAKKQFVAYGTHPRTSKPYHWPEGIPARSDLSEITQDDLDAFFQAVAEHFGGEAADVTQTEVDRSQIDQASLKGAPALLRSAMRDLPNRDEDFPTRDSYLRMGYALKAGFGPDGEDEAFELFLQWAGRWSRGGERNDPDVVEADWSRMKPPFAIGAGYIYDLAEKLGGWTGRAEEFFEPQELEGASEHMPPAKPTERKRIELLTDEDLQTRPNPTWLIEHHVPQDGVGILYGEPGAGKSFIALDMALHIATQAKDWHGEEIKGAERGAVLYIAGEGAGDFKTRVAAWKKQNFMPGEFVPNDRFRAILDPLDFRSEEDVKALIEAIREADLPKLSLVVIDTVARATPGADENSSLDMGLFIRACDAVRVLTGAFVLAVHHPNKSGGLRGSTALLGAADVVFRFERKKGQFYGRLKCEKMKAGRDDFETPFRLDVIELAPEISSLVPVRVEETEIKKAVCDEATEQAIHEAVQAAWDEGSPWSLAPQARERFAPRIVSLRWNVAADVAQQWLDLWLNGPEKSLEVATFDAKRHVKGLRTVRAGKDALSGSDEGLGVFE